MKHYTEPVIKDNFYLREDILSSLLKSTKDIEQGYRHNIAIIGKGLIGKSSLLLHFINILRDCKNLIPVYINLRGVTFDEFADNFIAALLYHCLGQKTVLKKPDDLKYLKAASRLLLPKTYELIKRIEALIAEKELDEAFSALWDLNVVVSSETGAYPVVVIDEFNLMSGFSLRSPFQALGQKIMVQQKTLFILSSSYTLTARKILSEKLSLLFGGFDIIDIGPFSSQQTKDLIQKYCKRPGMADELKGFLAAFTGGHPFYLDSILSRINADSGQNAERVSAKYLSKIIAELLFLPDGAINLFFARLIEQARGNTSGKVIFGILESILIPTQARQLIKKDAISSAKLQQALNNLLEAGLVSKSGSLYAVTDSLFRIWVGVKSRPQNLSFDFMPAEVDHAYIKEIEDRIADFRAEVTKPIDKKVAELISSFNNDRFFIDERIRTLPALDNISHKSCAGANIIIASGSKKTWVFVLSAKRIHEEDIYDAVCRIKKLAYQSPKIILISTSDIEISAKLLAKQKGIWVWNADTLGRLFEFYKGYNLLTA